MMIAEIIFQAISVSEGHGRLQKEKSLIHVTLVNFSRQRGIQKGDGHILQYLVTNEETPVILQYHAVFLRHSSFCLEMRHMADSDVYCLNTSRCLPIFKL